MRKENVPFQTPKTQPKLGKKNPPVPRSQPASTTKPPVSKPQAKKPDLRQEAMEAVNELHAHGIGYTELAKESIFDGFDKDLLRQLFKDAGIPLEESPPRQTPPPPPAQQPQLPEQVPSAQAVSPLATGGIDPALVNLLSQGGMNLDHQTLAKLAKAMGQNSISIPSPTPPKTQQSAPSNQSIIPGLAPSSQSAQPLAKSNNEASRTAQQDKVQTAIQQTKPVPEQKPASSTGQLSAREAYLAKLAAAKNKKKGAPTPGPPIDETAKPTVQQPSQALQAVVPPVTAKASTPAKQPVSQTQKPSSLPNAPGSTPSRSMVKMDVLQRKLDAERKAKQVQESAKANAQQTKLPPSRSDSISSIEYNQSNSESAQSAAGNGEIQEDWTQSGPATPNIGAQAIGIPNNVPSPIPGLFPAAQQIQPANSRRSQVQPKMHNLPARPEPPNQYQNQKTHVLPPRPPPVALTSSPKQPVQASRTQTWPSENSRKRPASAITGPPSFAPAKRQHEYTWNNRYSRPDVEVDESVVIDISSDDDDDGDDMEIDDEFQTSTTAPATKSLAAQKIPASRALPQGLSGPSPALVIPAAVSTPDPAGTAQAGNQQRLDELAEMKKRLQEQLKKKQELKKSKLATSGQQTPVPSSVKAPLGSVAAPKTSTSQAQTELETSTSESFNTTPKYKPVSATTKPISTPVLSSPQLPGRRSGLEAEISNDELLLLQMQRKMEEMQAKINRNKTELAQELEEIGIDTQGMSMETMEAVKEDIAQATQDDAAIEPPEPEADTTPVPEPALPINLHTQMAESESENEEGEIDETKEVSEDAPLQQSRVEATESSHTTNSVPAAQESSNLAVVAPVAIAGDESHVLEAAVEADDKMSESSDSSSEDDDEDDNEEYEPEALLAPATETMTLNDDSDNDKMSTSSGSSDSSDSDQDSAEGAQISIHEQAIEEESSEESDSSDEDDIYQTTLETPAPPALDATVAETDGVATEMLPAVGQTLKEANTDVVEEASDSSEDGEISENDNSSAHQLQPEAAMNEEDDYEPEAAPISNSNPVLLSPPMADVNNETSGPDSMAVQTDIAVPKSKLPEAASSGPSAAAVSEHEFVLPGLGSTVAYISQPAAPTDSMSAAMNEQVMENDEEDDYVPPVATADHQDDEALSDDDADLYEPSPADQTAETSAELPATTGAAEAGLSSDEDELMIVDDGNIVKSAPETDHKMDVDNESKLVPGLDAASIVESAVATPTETTQRSTPILDVGVASPDSSNVPSVIADDLAPELRPTADAINTTASATPSTPSASFVPYSSPLRMFKAYRYHSNFRNEVAGGFKSLTYSNTIDPGLPLCPIEMAGASCDDPNCAGQHMRDMGLADNMILVQLGSLNPGRTDEDKKRWADGLRTLIGNLRTQGVKETDVVASQIASYRRNFFKDQSRIFDI
ncbi:protein red1 [Venturia nashicola]|uniref:Protein red1 n=1 Tax=Venturia nashicola TaxID=86259 RepID=A0A4Z1PF57_9PEZI|nr:protein red1 [Venturia nashicola]